MKFRMKYILVFVMMLAIYGCANDKKNREQGGVRQQVLPKGLQQQLEEEFGKYTEEIKPGDSAYYTAYDKTLALLKTPFHQVNIPTRYGNAHVIVGGHKSAEPLVLLHGMDASSTMWYANFKALSENHRVYAIDNLMEPGKSQLHGEVKDMKEVVKWYNEIFAHLKLEKFSLIGASKGGWLSVNIALEQKSKIRKLILLSPAQTFMWIQPGPDYATNITYTLDPKRKKLRKVLETMSGNVDNIADAWINQYFIATENANKKLILEMTPYDNDELKTLTMPVLLLIGEKDIINKKRSIKKAKRLLPNVETGIIENAGHFLNFDQPENVNKRMLDFLNAKED